MTQNLKAKKLQIVRDTIKSERFLELLGLHIGAYKDLKIDSRAGFTDSPVVALRIDRLDGEDDFSDLEFVVQIDDNLDLQRVSASLNGLYSQLEIRDILQLTELLKMQVRNRLDENKGEQ